MDQPNSSGSGSSAGSSPASGAIRDPRLAWFASGGCYDRGRPAAGMADALEGVTDGSGRPPLLASDDEVIGMLGGWQALEAHAHARTLAIMRELIRRRPKDSCPASYPGALPAQWETGAAYEVAAELGISWQAAAPMLHLAWELEARLPDVGQLLDQGVLSAFKVKIVVGEFEVLDDQKVAEAQARLLERDLGAAEMTPAKLRNLCQRVADGIDPEGARNRREQAQRDRARVEFYRAHGGDTAMFAEGLPPDQALMAKANIQARALDYHKAKVYPEAGMDLLRVLALLDLINGVTLRERFAKWRATDAAAEDARQREQRARDQETAESLGRRRSGTPSSTRHVPSPQSAGDPEPGGGPDSGGDTDWPEPPLPDTEPPDDDDFDFWPGYPPPGDDPGPSGSGPGGSGSAGFDEDDGPDDDGPDDDGPDDDGPGDEDPGGGGGGPGSKPGGGPGGVPGRKREPGLPALTHLTLPLRTLMGLAQTPGAAPGYGSVDSALVRDLARAAAKSPRTRYCFTVTDEQGHAIGHACGQPIRATGYGSRDGPVPGGWDIVPDDTRSGPDGGYGAWILAVPGGTRYRLSVDPVPLHECDHRLATDSYRPGALLRHLVEIRDGECSFTGCSHPADQCDFEHGIPWHKGGMTDACNGAPRSRSCHRVKQSPGWSVTQPEPGLHQWHTPAGRTYQKGSKSYPS